MLFKYYDIFSGDLSDIDDKKKIITTINAHSYNVSRVDSVFSEALAKSDVLIPDGISIVWADRFLTGRKIKKIAGEDLFNFEMKNLQSIKGSCFFLGSSETTLSAIKEKASKEYPNVKVYTYSPPYKEEFSNSDNYEMISAINRINPNVLFIGLTAPKQEKWAYKHFDKLKTGHICCIGAVFDFYAGTINRAPKLMIKFGLEWFYRLLKEPRRMWRRYMIGNAKFIFYIIKEKYFNRNINN